MLVNSLWGLLGRRNLVRFSRFLANESRLDVRNEMTSNGELLIQQIVLKQLVAGESKPIVFDVGANVGEWSRNFMAECRRGGITPELHLFEPSRVTFETLKSKLAEWNLTDKAVLNNLALSSGSGTRVFYSVGDNCGRNGLYPIDGEARTSETVTASTIDEYCGAHAVDSIAFLKIDTEGHDLEVIYGATGKLKEAKIRCIQFEYNQRWIDARHYLRDAFGFLNPLGYVIGKITPLGVEFYEGWDMELETYREANYISLRESDKAFFPQIKWWNAAGKDGRAAN
ncbi:MAG TPA: FkbM family methyltransferase [Planctomycetota bacterium]|nr:FkbM family methyltransferase [Planctomycetota bacterium]